MGKQKRASCRLPEIAVMQQDRTACYENLQYQAARKFDLIKEFIETQSRTDGWHLFLGLGTTIHLASRKKRVPSGIGAIYNECIPLSIDSLVQEFLKDLNVARDEKTDYLLAAFLTSLLKSLPENIPLSYFPSTFATKNNPAEARAKLGKTFHSFKRYDQTASAYIKIAYLCTLDNEPEINAVKSSRLSDIALPQLSYFSENPMSSPGTASTHQELKALLNEAVMTSDPQTAIPILWTLGEQYLINRPDYEKNNTKAFHYFSRAANLGCAQALPVLQRLAKNSKSLKKKLSNANGQSFFRKKAIPLTIEKPPSPVNESGSSCQNSIQ